MKCTFRSFAFTVKSLQEATEQLDSFIQGFRNPVKSVQVSHAYTADKEISVLGVVQIEVPSISEARQIGWKQ